MIKRERFIVSARAPGRGVKKLIIDQGAEPPARSVAGIVRRVTLGSVRYLQKYVKCGRGCSRCRAGGENFSAERPGHGPYWYAEGSVEGRVWRRYVGVHLREIEGRGEGGGGHAAGAVEGGVEFTGGALAAGVDESRGAVG